MRRIEVLACVLVCSFAALRVVGTAVKRAKKPYVGISTDAGPVRVADNLSAYVYSYLKSNSLPDEPLADLAYGGGLNVALHRSSPIFSTQFVNFRPTAAHLERDARQLSSSKVRFVIGRSAVPTSYGTGLGCAFPHFLWKAPRCSDSETTVFPITKVVTQLYRPVTQVGEIIVYSLPATVKADPSRESIKTKSVRTVAGEPRETAY